MDSEDVMYDWKSISLTHVEYQKGTVFFIFILSVEITIFSNIATKINIGDNVGMLLAWCSLLPIFILVSLFTLVLFRRDLHTVS